MRCERCGKNFNHQPTGKGGRPPKFCPAHRKSTGPAEGRDHAGNKARKNGRRRTKTAAVEGQAVAANEHVVADLAAALAVYPEPRQAATYLGLALDDDALASLADRARRTHALMTEGDPSALSPRVLLGLHLFLTAAIAQRHLVSPRDLGALAGQFAKVHAALELGTTTRFSEIHLSIKGPENAT